MATITDVTLTRLDSGTVEIAWSGTSGRTHRVYRDGELMAGPDTIAAVSKSVELDWGVDKNYAIEVQEENADGSYSAYIVAPRVRPILRWEAVPAAEYYKIYHQEGEGGAESWIESVSKIPTLAYYNYKLGLELNGEGGAWHFFRVEAVDADGVESTTATYATLVREVPPPVSNIAVAVTGGLGTVTITE